MKTKSSLYRLEYLDWVRGLGAAVMLQGHVFHSYLKPELKQSGPYLISQLDWSGVPLPVRSYIIPDYNSFGIFPWGAYLAFGISAGSIIRTVPPDAVERAMLWAAVLGGAVILACQYFANSPYQIYSKS